MICLPNEFCENGFFLNNKAKDVLRMLLMLPFGFHKDNDIWTRGLLNIPHTGNKPVPLNISQSCKLRPCLILSGDFTRKPRVFLHPQITSLKPQHEQICAAELKFNRDTFSCYTSKTEMNIYIMCSIASLLTY